MLKDLRKLRILVVEDEIFYQRLISGVLNDLNCKKFVVAESGVKAIEDISLAQNEFDLILLNLSMPEMDGIEFLSWLRNAEGQVPNTHIPVIIVTTDARLITLIELENIGIQGYIVKPYCPLEIMFQISKALSFNHSIPNQSR